MNKIMKIGPVDPEKIWLKLKSKEEITEYKICSPVSKFDERAKQTIDDWLRIEVPPTTFQTEALTLALTSTSDLDLQ